MPRVPLLLCIDDEMRPLIMRQLLLQSEGYKVITASTSEDAINAVKQNPVDLVITDQLLVMTTGIELAAKLKNLRADIPILLLTGLVDFPTPNRNIDAIMSKVDGPEAFLERVSALLKKSSQPSRRTG